MRKRTSAPIIRLYLSIAGALLMFAGVISPAWTQPPDPSAAARLMDDLMWGRAQVGGPFKLMDQTGKVRTDADFRGKLLLVYFGYTYCPDICPADLMQISLALNQLGAAAAEVQPLFISLDPERDTAAVLAKYVSSFHPSLIGLTGTGEQIRSVAHAYKVYYAKYKSADGAPYLIDHSGFTYLMDRKGRYLGFFPPGTSASRFDEIIRPYLATN